MREEAYLDNGFWGGHEFSLLWGNYFLCFDREGIGGRDHFFIWRPFS